MSEKARRLLWGVGDAVASSALFDAADAHGDAVLSFEELVAVVDRRFGR